MQINHVEWDELTLIYSKRQNIYATKTELIELSEFDCASNEV